MATRHPNFFIVGAAKSGTTSVAKYLGEHPQVYMSPIKEPSYFARDMIRSSQFHGWSRDQRGLERYLNGPMTSSRGGCVLEWEAYLKLFRNVAREIAIGEASTAYLISPEAPSDIRAAIPNARIIIVLRSPIERAFSTYVMFCRNGRLRASFSDIIRSHASGALSTWRRMILETRKIAPGVERFLKTFPPDQVRWYFHEELSSDPVGFMQRIYSFIGVDPTFSPDVSRRYNEEMLPRIPLLHFAAYASGVLKLAGRVVPSRTRPALRRFIFKAGPVSRPSRDDKAILADYFNEDVNHLSRLVQKDLSHWLRID
jgi:hypothetical protein